MGANNPMHVKKYTYKVEFQDRGAGHIHGTLWLRLDKIESMRDPEGHAKFEGLTSAFKKFRNNDTLSETEEKSVVNFIDEFTTVSTHENTVGREVARIAEEVNTHHHTKTCRKHDTSCRFKYPRYPAPYTIIVKPSKEESQEQIDKKLTKCKNVLRKVKEVLDNEELIGEIMNNYRKQEETKQEFKENIKLRIEELLKKADVDYDDYIEALSTSKTGYSILQQRDLDEI